MKIYDLNVLTVQPDSVIIRYCKINTVLIIRRSSTCTCTAYESTNPSKSHFSQKEYNRDRRSYKTGLLYISSLLIFSDTFGFIRECLSFERATRVSSRRAITREVSGFATSLGGETDCIHWRWNRSVASYNWRRGKKETYERVGFA